MKMADLILANGEKLSYLPKFTFFQITCHTVFHDDDSKGKWSFSVNWVIMPY